MEGKGMEYLEMNKELANNTLAFTESIQFQLEQELQVNL